MLKGTLKLPSTIPLALHHPTIEIKAHLSIRAALQENVIHGTGTGLFQGSLFESAQKLCRGRAIVFLILQMRR